MLRAAGVEFLAESAGIDESAIKREYQRTIDGPSTASSAQACAAELALAKACAVGARHPEAIVIGADQILVADDEWFDKPADLAEATAQLQRLSGRTHLLLTAACAVRDETCLWTAAAAPKLTMRRLGEKFLAEYIAAEGKTVLGSVGAYQLEGRGVQLFARIEGDYFAILGLPLIELLEFLRQHDLLGE